ncbi:MAG: hypothetical protein P9E24_03840 [Candidatus Competibacter sp.]|nr:hypothetical protein [Candidatus Competibacter sp.]MDG4584402.1 hypothetical protein [Candidatus Competibacter sp.]
MKEDAITTFNRRLRILAMFKGSEPLTTPMIFQRLRGTAEEMDERSVQRALALLGEALSGSGRSRRQALAVALAQGPEVPDPAPPVRSGGAGVPLVGAVSEINADIRIEQHHVDSTKIPRLIIFSYYRGEANRVVSA